jgi:glycosyltransferase involved in cell wall biosynthesis
MVALKKIMFSIILPTYNRAHMISRAIESVINQTYDNWELIIIDDGSTDNTKELVRTYIDKDSRIKYHYQENAERSAARNNGIKLAKGEYICFLDSDDEFLSNHLKTFKIEIIKSNGSQKTLFYTLKTKEEPQSHTNKLVEVFISNIHSQQVCGSKKIFSKYKYDININIGEDKELFMRIVQEFDLFQIRKATIQVIEHLERSVHIQNLDSAIKHFQIVSKLSRLYRDKIPKHFIKAEMSRALFTISKSCIYNDNYKKAMSYSLRSIFTNVFDEQTKHKALISLALVGLYKRSLLKEYQAD